MESYLGNLEKRIKCSVCNDTLVDPKLANCFHAFCKQCIKTLFVLHVNDGEDHQRDYTFTCPQCQCKTLLQDLNDVDDLQSSPVHSRILNVLEFIKNQKICSVNPRHSEALSQCLDCGKSLCEECLNSHSKFTKAHQVVSFPELKKEDIDRLLRKEPLCKTHNNQYVSFYCHDCDMPICVLCLNEHDQQHNTTAMQDMMSIETDPLSQSLNQISTMTTNEKKQQKEISLSIKRDGEKAKQQVIEFTETLVKTLRNNEQHLLNKIQESITKAQWNLRIISHTAQAQEYIDDLMENSAASDLDTRHKNSSTNFTYAEHFDETSCSGIEFKPNEKLYEQVRHGLELVPTIFKRPDPKMSSIEVVPSDLEAIKKAKLVVKLKTSEGQVTREHLENVVIHFIPEDAVKINQRQIIDDSEIKVEFTPRVACELTVDVTIHGNPVRNSPLVVHVKPQQIREITGHSKLRDTLNIGSKTFRGIALNKTNSKIAEADFESDCIRVVSMEGDLLLTFDGESSGQGKLTGPEGLAFLNETDLVIADSNNHRICIVDTSTGQLSRCFGCHGNGNGQFKYPCGVHVDDNKNIIVCDQYNSRVQVFTNDGDYLYQFSVPGYPCSVVSYNGLFYVSTKNVVYVFEMRDNQSPTNLATIDGKDIPDVQLQGPYGLAIDNDNNLLVCDSIACLIYKFTLDGRYVGQSSLLNNSPRYIAVLNEGRLICTTKKGEVMFFFKNCNCIIVLVIEKKI